MQTLLRPCLALTAALTLLTGLAYPLAVTGAAGLLAPGRAAGSLVGAPGQAQPVGSALIGQGFAAPGYLAPRPSATGWNAAASGGSNLGPTSAVLLAQVAERRAAWVAANGTEPPIDALTASGSGLDPDISPANARGQAGRIATARGVALAEVLAVIAQQTKGRWLGIYGAPRVNVLATNLALDAAFGQGTLSPTRGAP